MATDNDMAVQEYEELHRKRIRFWMFWITAVLATLIFLLFMATMLMVPGVLPTTKLWMLSTAGIAVAISLGIGSWKFGTTEAPVMTWPMGPVMGVVLLLELAECTVNVFHLVLTMHH